MILVFLFVLIVLVLILVLYYSKIREENYVNVFAVQKTSEVEGLDKQLHDLAESQQSTKSDIKSYKESVDKRFDMLNDKTTNFQTSKDSQITEINNMKIIDGEIIVDDYEPKLKQTSNQSMTDSNWIHVVRGELLQANASMKQPIADLVITHKIASSNVDSYYTSGILKTKGAVNDINNAFTLLSSQITDNQDKTFSDLSQIENSLNTNRDNLNSSIQQITKDTTFIQNDKVLYGALTAPIADANNGIVAIKNDYVSKGVYNGTMDSLDQNFNNYPSTSVMTQSYWPLRSGQQAETSLKNIDLKVTTQQQVNNNPDYVLKSVLTNNYYDKSATDNTLNSRTSSYLLSSNAETQYYPIVSGQKLESTIKGFDTTIKTIAASGTTVTTNKMCVGNSCIDEIALKTAMSKVESTPVAGSQVGTQTFETSVIVNYKLDIISAANVKDDYGAPLRFSVSYVPGNITASIDSNGVLTYSNLNYNVTITGNIVINISNKFNKSIQVVVPLNGGPKPLFLQHGSLTNLGIGTYKYDVANSFRYGSSFYITENPKNNSYINDTVLIVSAEERNTSYYIRVGCVNAFGSANSVASIYIQENAPTLKSMNINGAYDSSRGYVYINYDPYKGYGTVKNDWTSFDIRATGWQTFTAAGESVYFDGRTLSLSGGMRYTKI